MHSKLTVSYFSIYSNLIIQLLKKNVILNSEKINKNAFKLTIHYYWVNWFINDFFNFYTL